MSNFNYTDLVKAERDRRVNQQKKTTNEALDKQKAEFEAKKKKRTERKVARAEGVMGAIGSFAESVASGLEAEGLRRAKFGGSGIGMARAFSSGASEIIDFSRLQKAKRKSALAQKLGFTPADAGSGDDIQRIIDALTDYEARQNANVGATNTTTDDDASDDEVKEEPKDDPLATGSPQQGSVTEPTNQEKLNEAAGENQTPLKPLKTGNPVLDNIVTYPEVSTFGSRAFDDLGFTVEDENDNGIPDIMENN